jgi:hypothetical protein
MDTVSTIANQAVQDSSKIFGYISEDTFNTLLGAGIALIGSIFITLLVQISERKKWKKQREWERKMLIYKVELEQIENDIKYYEEILSYSDMFKEYWTNQKLSDEFKNKIVLKLRPKEVMKLAFFDNRDSQIKKEFIDEMMMDYFSELINLKNKKDETVREMKGIQ